MVGLSRSLRLQPTDQTRTWEDGSGGGGLDAAKQLTLDSRVDRPYKHVHIQTCEHRPALLFNQKTRVDSIPSLC